MSLRSITRALAPLNHGFVRGLEDNSRQGERGERCRDCALGAHLQSSMRLEGIYEARQ